MSTFVEPAGESVTRGVERRVAGQETQDGAGVRLTRLITPALQQRLDPFLMHQRHGLLGIRQ